MHTKILYFLPVFLAACSSSVSTYTDLAPSKPATLPLQTIVGANTAYPTTTLTPRQTIESVEPPLDSQGPWIFAYNEYSSNSPYFLNLDGSGYFSTEIPSFLNWYNYCPGSSNASSLNGYKIFCIQDSDQFVFNIIDESDGTLLRAIPLYGEQALRLFEDFILPEPYFYPPFPMVKLAIGRYNWSPDGKYIAFVGAMEGPSGDIYIYEPEHDSIRRLTSGPGQAHIMGWSPDSRSIVHASGEVYDVFNTLMANEVWSVDIDGHITFITQLEINGSGPPIISEWISNDTYISLRPTFEGNPTDLSLVNISSLDITPIYAPRLLYVLYDSSHNRILINWGPAMGPGDYGVYEYNLNTNQLKDFATGVEIDEILTLVPYYFARSGALRVLLDGNGDTVSELNCQQSDPKISPDGRFTLKPDNGEIILTGSELNTFRKLGDVILAHWLPDSSGFYGYTGEYDLYETNIFQVYLYSEVKDWQPVLVNTLSIYGCFTFVSP